MSSHLDPRLVRAALACYARPSPARSVFELVVTAAPLAAFWALALVVVGRGWLWGALFTLPAAAFLVRLFMIQHDCGHRAFFRSRSANDWTGRIAGLLTMTPYDYWRRTHAMHHATSGNLDRRGLGAVETLTVAEYQARPLLKRLGYRLYRHPLVLFGLGPAYMFVLQHRLPIGLMNDRRAWLSALGVNVGLALLVLLEVAGAGLPAVLLVHLPIMLVAATIGVWLFYVQHQFEDGYWARNEAWTAQEAALRGSSHLDLPPLLQWFTANIGAHHIHHLGSRIPFYRLPAALRDHPELGAHRRITLRESLWCARLALWDEAAGRLVAFRKFQSHSIACDSRSGGSRTRRRQHTARTSSC
jgi:omega-6 fatty acid desaturase (delta-12 desaturase)